MRLDSKDAEYLRQIEEDAIAAHTAGGKVDNAKAVAAVWDRLVRMQGIGQDWASAVLDDAMAAGLLQRLKRRQKAMRVYVRVSGAIRSMPRSYSQDGQLAFWMTVSRAELEALVDELAGQSKVLGQNAGVMRWALHLMDKHNAATADAAFQAEGIDPTAVDGINVPKEWSA